jgi:hypothetical protein
VAESGSLWSTSREWAPVLAVTGAAAGGVAALSLLWLATEAHYRGCVARVEARYPPIAVSSFSGQQTGPLKVAYDVERAAAIRGCDHVPW